MKEELQDGQDYAELAESDLASRDVNMSPIPGMYRVMRRNGKVTSYDLSKITVAMTKAFLSVEGSSAAASTRIHNEVESLAEKVDVAIKEIKKDSRKIVLSIKLLEEIDRDTALKTYGSEASGKNLPFSSLSEDLKKKEEDKE